MFSINRRGSIGSALLKCCSGSNSVSFTMASTAPLHIPRFLSTIGRNRNDGASIKGVSSIVKSPAKRLNRISNSNSRPHRIPPNRTYINQNKSITLLSKNEDLQGLLSFKSDGVVFNEVNWSTLFNKLGRFKGRKDEVRHCSYSCQFVAETPPLEDNNIYNVVSA